MNFLLTPNLRKQCCLIFSLTIFALSSLSAQISCQYKIELSDAAGDGWNGGVLTVVSNGVESTFSLEEGDFGMGSFEVEDGAAVSLLFEQGSMPEETSFEVFDPEGILIFAAAGPITNGQLYNEQGMCPSCISPFDAFMADVNADNAQIAWTAPDGFSGNYRIEFDTLGFALGEGQMLSVPYPSENADLTGLAENTTYEIYIFLDCGSDSSSLVGPIEFHTLWLNDVGVTNITAPTDDSCILGPSETITIEMTNFGQVPQTLFDFFFSVNGQVANIPMPQDGFFTGVIGNDSTQSISFETTWDFSQPDLYTIEAWTVLEEDSLLANDTFRIEVATAFQMPVAEDFEDALLPEGWASNGGAIFADMNHGNETVVWGVNLSSANNGSTLTTAIVGPVSEGDSLIFDYRFVDAMTLEGIELQAGDVLNIRISEDCGETFETVFTIDASNHIASQEMATLSISLEDFAEKPIVVEFSASWGAGDYWLDLDNINVTGCPATLAIVPEIKGTDFGVTNGEITVMPSFGTAPYTYEWDNGEDTETITDLGTGSYTVTVTDANGCMDTETYELGFLVNAEEVAGVNQILLYPNPTRGLVTLGVSLTEAMDFEMKVLNLSGQVIYQSQREMASQVREELNLSGQPAGIYLLQVIANGQPHFAKIMVAK